MVTYFWKRFIRLKPVSRIYVFLAVFILFLVLLEFLRALGIAIFLAGVVILTLLGFIETLVSKWTSARRKSRE